MGHLEGRMGSDERLCLEMCIWESLGGLRGLRTMLQEVLMGWQEEGTADGGRGCVPALDSPGEPSA